MALIKSLPFSDGYSAAYWKVTLGKQPRNFATDTVDVHFTLTAWKDQAAFDAGDTSAPGNLSAVIRAAPIADIKAAEDIYTFVYTWVTVNMPDFSDAVDSL